MEVKATITWQYIADNVHLRGTTVGNKSRSAILIGWTGLEMRRDVRYESWHLNNRNACYYIGKRLFTFGERGHFNITQIYDFRRLLKCLCHD
jgi:hypothetical protein